VGVKLSGKAAKAYDFLVSKEKTGEPFTADDLSGASGWSPKTTRIYLSKKLGNHIVRANGELHCSGVAGMARDSFCRLFSQKADIARDPERPLLHPRVEALVEKAREAALAAVQHYNNPTAKFRSGNFLILMVIAYTSLFHAIFERDGVRYEEEQSDGKPPRTTRQGEPFLWDVVKSAKHYYKGQTTPTLKNLEIMNGLRDKVEHRFLAGLDPDLVGHCQAMVLNFEDLLRKEFSPYYSLNCSLAVALQLSAKRPPETVAALRRLQSAEYDELRKYLDDFQAAVPDEILFSQEFCFRVWLVPKLVNRESAADLAIEFVPIGDLKHREEVQAAIVAYKTKKEIIDASQCCDHWEAQVVVKLRAAIGSHVTIGGQPRAISGVLVRRVRDKLGITSPSEYYYRANIPGDRPRYSKAFIDLVLKELRGDPDPFFSSEAPDAC